MKPTIALVQCPPWTVLAPPLHIGYLAAYLREKGFPVSVFDFNIETYAEESEENRYFWSRDLPSTLIKEKSQFMYKRARGWAKRVLDSGADIIGVHSFYDGRHISTEFINRIKEEDRSRLVVAGGPQCHPGNRREEVLNQKNVDIFVTGEGETTLLEIARQYWEKSKVEFCRGTIIRKGDQLVDCGPGNWIRNLDSLPFPDFEGIPLKEFVLKEEIPILFSRGCIGRCAFCQEQPNLGPYRSRSARNIFDEMKERYEQGYRVFFVNDLTANGDVRQLDTLSKLLIKSDLRGNVRLTGQMRCRKEMTRTVYERLYRAGWRIILYGVESGSQKILDAMRKGYKVGMVEQNLRDSHNAGIETKINLIVGFPGETEESFQETLGFLRRNRRHIDVLGALYELELRQGSRVSTRPEEYSIAQGGMYWRTSDNKNTPGWRLELIYRVLKEANSLDIKIGFDDAHFYFSHALDYYHNHLKDYDKSYEIMMDALQYLGTRLKKCRHQDG